MGPPLVTWLNHITYIYMYILYCIHYVCVCVCVCVYIHVIYMHVCVCVCVYVSSDFVEPYHRLAAPQPQGTFLPLSFPVIINTLATH
jgi:hypothetical protein